MAQSHWNFSNLPDRDTEPEPPSSLGALEEPTPREPEPLTQRYNFSNLPDLEEPEARPAFEQGNVNLFNRPKVQNPDGTISTVRSMSFQDDDGREVLVPTVSDDGRIMGDDEAIAQYRESGKHLGKFTDIDSANRYAETLHDEYEQGVYDEVPKSWWEWGSDLVIGGAKGVIGVGEAAVGLIDIPTLGHAGKFMEETLGYDPEEAKQILTSYQSTASRRAQAGLAEAEGFWESLEAIKDQPFEIVSQALARCHR
jgi:hypothetical protein